MKLDVYGMMRQLRLARKYYYRLALSRDIIGKHDYVMGIFEGFDAACKIVWRFLNGQKLKPEYFQTFPKYQHRLMVDPPTIEMQITKADKEVVNERR